MIFKKIKYRIKLAQLTLKSKLSIPFVLKETKLIVLNYHGLVKDSPLKFNSKFITVEEFEKHLSFFKQHCNVLSLAQANKTENLVSKKLNVVITFDDGYRNNLKYALPLLRKYNFEATFCVTFPECKDILWADLFDLSCAITPNHEIEVLNKKWVLGRDKEILKTHLKNANEKEIQIFYNGLNDNFSKIKKDESLGDYWELMNQNELQELAKHPLISIVPHGSLHVSLTAMNEEDAYKDAQSSIKKVETLTGKVVDTFCYPNGDYNQKIKTLLREKGMKNQLVVDYYLKEDVFEKDIISRFVINPHISFDLQMRFMYLGKYF